MLSVLMPSPVMLSAVVVSAVMLSAVMVRVIMLSDFMPRVIMLSVIMLNVDAECRYAECRGTIIMNEGCQIFLTSPVKGSYSNDHLT
jgi:hypothetical protein